MRRIPVFTIAVLVVIIFLPSLVVPTRYAQEKDIRVDFSKYPEAGPNCKSYSKRVLAPWM
jgi:hypothetical protein